MDKKAKNPLTAGVLVILVVALTVVSIYGILTVRNIPQPSHHINVDGVYGLGDIGANTYSVKLEGVNYTLLEVEPTHSMLPTIPDNSIVIVKKNINIGSIKIGDIIVFRTAHFNELVCHRVIGIKKDDGGVYFETKGDNAWLPDTWKVRPNDIVGVVVGVIW